MITGPEYKSTRPIFTLNSLPSSGMVTAPKYCSKKKLQPPVKKQQQQKKDSLAHGDMKSEEHLILRVLNPMLLGLLRALLRCNSFIMQK